MIESFPEKELFEFSVGGMRPFAALASEMIRLAGPGLRGLVTDDWSPRPREATTRAELLQHWDETTAELDELWPKMSAARFHAPAKAFGQWEAPAFSHLLYWIDNEIHHRGQGYVYLRALGVEPPPFWDRG
jgi:uncharacterized damage-inducible protein DinB